ncbi:MAG: tetratricopeptide repeat protein [Elusimicrobium sp.]|uniref:Tetratricopeptide repeat protein n=1 Tax=Candidatus Avelusimicrobium gallicola TaxID=2562704 RepID=A0A928HIG0_9BACT|nr:tetratricopeptide repeat protein [Elusimicrobium sp.]
MRLLKPFSVSLLSCLLVGLVVAPAKAQAKMDACLAEGKKFFSSKEYEAAQKTFSRCVKLNPSNVDAQLSLAGVFLTQDKLNEAEKAFQSAIKSMKRNSPYWSYTYSMLGDIALKRQQNKQALDLYTKSLSFNAANVNSLVGKGVITEYQGDKQGSAEYYRSALAVEPLNLIARKRLINLEPEYLTNDEILAALKQRYAVPPDTKELTDEYRKLFEKIHQAEQRRGVDYLKNKHTKVSPEYVVTLNKDTEFEREMLTAAGFKVLEKNIGQDAIAVFQRVGVPIQDVFELRNKKGEKIFTPESTLTESGFFVYTEALQNRKAFLLPHESVPPTQAFLEKIAKHVKDLEEAGYIEISRSEYKMIENQTKCSEETLRTRLGLYIMQINKNDRRYFVQSRPTRDPKKGVPYYYLMAAHAKRNPKIKVPRNSLVENYAYYGYSICLDDGNLLE